MSARYDVLAALADLDTKKYMVTDKPPTSETRILKDRAIVTAQRAGVTPASGSGAWAHAIPVVVVVGAESYTTAEDTLDALLPGVVAAIEAARNIAVVSIDRDMFFEADGFAGFHGYRITTTTITDSI